MNTRIFQIGKRSVQVALHFVFYQIYQNTTNFFVYLYRYNSLYIVYIVFEDQ